MRSKANETVKLTADIDLENKEWTPIGKSGSTFQGTFDGQGHTISNLKTGSSQQSDVGLFGVTANGEVKNFTLQNANVTGYLDVGAIAGTPYTSKYTDITLRGKITVNGYAYVGGAFGKNAYADLTNITINVESGSYVKADSENYRTYVGGLVGFMGEGSHVVKDVTSNIDVIGSTCDVGGITGIAHYGNTFENCSSSGNVTLVNAQDEGDHLEIGGIAGVWHDKTNYKVTFKKCDFTGQLSTKLNGVDKTSELSELHRIAGRRYGAGTGSLIIDGVIQLPQGTTPETINNVITNSKDAEGNVVKDVKLALPSSSTFELNNGLAHEGDKSRNVTIVGDGSQTVDVVTKAISAEGGQLNYQRGSSFTFENLTIQAGEGNFDGIVCNELTYKDCTIKGKLTLFGKATFIDCTFDNTMANQYSIWTWGGTDVTFENCTFNTNGKAILLYGGADGKNPTNLVVNKCTFNDRNNGTAGKAAIEIGNDYNATYSLTVTNATVNGFANGKNTGSKLWANKNSMEAKHLSVTIDGTQVL